MLLVSALIALTVLGSVAHLLPGIASFIGSLSPTPSHSSRASTSSPPTPNCQPAPPPVNGIITATAPICNGPPQTPVPDLSLPTTVFSNIDSKVGEGGVIRYSADNLTLYNLGLAVRLYGGLLPSDDFLDTGHSSSIHTSSLWGVEVNSGAAWVPLVPTSNEFSVLATNSSGTYVSRTMSVNSILGSGQLEVIYDATSQGTMKWNLAFTPSTSGTYRLAYNWRGLPSSALADNPSRKLSLNHPGADYTLSWADVPDALNRTTSLSQGVFSLAVHLGMIHAGSTVRVDPSISTSTSQSATGNSYERHIFYEPTGGNYWAFYYDGGSMKARYSSDGVSWFDASSGGTLASTYNPWYDGPALYMAGQTVVVAQGEVKCCDFAQSPYTDTVHLYYGIGTISGTSIQWAGPYAADTETRTCDSQPSSTGYYYCTMTMGMKHVSATVGADGKIAFGWNWFWRYWPWLQLYLSCSDGSYSPYSESVFYGYSNGQVRGWGGNAQPLGGCYNYQSDNMYSVTLPSDSSGGIRWVFEDPQHTYGSSQPNPVTSTWINLTAWTGAGCCHYDVLATNVANDAGGTTDLSGVSDLDYGTHVVYKTTDGKITYQYHGSSAGGWITPATDIFSGGATSPSLSVDQSTNDIYASAIQGSSIVMRSKATYASWSDQQPFFPLTGRTSPAHLTAGVTSVRTTSQSRISLLWTEGSASPYQVWYAGIPIPTVWSPFSSPKSPWDGNGIVPFGQYFTNLGEYVSPSTGMLTVRQTDLSLPGRGLSIDITRVYTEPYSFLSGNPYNYETYPWAPIGKAWQLNFPWLSNAVQPLYIHLWDGQGYRIPSRFWTGLTATFENHQGENFRLVRNSDGTINLYFKTISFNFDPNHKLTSITDSTGNNVINFAYDGSNHISTITDTVGRTLLFCYNSGLLHSINQTTSNNCSNGTGSARGIVYVYNSNAGLASVIDPAGRVTSLSYASTAVPANASPWILTRVTYPTGWYGDYTYATFQLGTESNTFYSYRVTTQFVGDSSSSQVRKALYTYTQTGDQIVSSEITTYGGGGSASQVQTYTDYAFSFAGMTQNVSDSTHKLVKGTQQLFGTHGEVIREIIFSHSVYDSSISSYTNYYSYDLWGDPIYSRQALLPGSTTSVEKFNAYYNNGEPPGFYSFEDSFSQNQGTASDNQWNTLGGTWTVANGVYSGTETNGAQENMLSSADIGKGDISIQAHVYMNNLVNNTAGYWDRFGIFTHYQPGSSRSYKWALVIHSTSGAPVLELLDEYNVWLGGSQSSAVSSCPGISGLLAPGTWYTFNMTVHGYSATGWIATPSGQPSCTVTGTFSSSSPATGGTSFGLYAGGYSALFDDVLVTTVSPAITGTGFSKSFISNGSPGPIGLNTWLATSKPPLSGWTTDTNWLPASGWSPAYRMVDYTGAPWGTVSGWTDNQASWIWWQSNGASTGSSDPMWARRVFYLPSSTTLSVRAVPDDSMSLYVDGGLVLSGGGGGTITNSVTLASGYHVLSVYATNPNGPDPAGFMVSVVNTGNGQVLFHTDGVEAPNITDPAGTAVLQNGANSQSEENYFAYTAAGQLSQANQLYVGSTIVDSYTSTQPSAYFNMGLWQPPEFYQMAQPFSTGPASIPLYQVQLVLDKAGTPSGPMYAELWSGGYTPGSLLATSLPIDASTLTSSMSTYTFTFSSPLYSLAPNTQYYILLDASGVNLSTTNSVNIQWDFPNGPRGIVWYRPNPTYGWSGYNGVTLTFAVIGTATSWVTSTRTYDSFGNLLSLTDPRGYSTSYTYSTRYQSAYMTSQTQTLIPGNIAIVNSYGYNFTTGTSIWSQQPNGYGATTYNSTYKYDILNRPTLFTYPTGDYVAYTYNDAANYVDATNENGWRTRQTYDGLGRLSTTQRFANGQPITSETDQYNWMDKVVVKTDAIGNTYQYTYDALGRLTATIEPTANYTALTYDDVNARVWAYNEAYLAQYFNNDRSGRLLSSCDYTTGYCVSSTRDQLGNVLSQTNTAGSTYFLYDSLNRLEVTRYPDGTTEAYGYDNNGNVVTKVDRNCLQTIYSYDSLNRIASITYHGTPTTTDSYSYDGNSNLVQLVSQNATLGYRYDQRNRVTGETYSINGGLVDGPLGGGGGGGSVADGTLITTSDGRHVPVQQLTAGTSLLSYNVTTGTYVTSIITKMTTVHTNNMLVIKTADGIPLRTDNATIQLLWVRQSNGHIGWLSVTRLKVGDSLYKPLEQKWTVVTEIQYIPGSFTMYDIYTTAPYDYLANDYLDPVKAPTPMHSQSSSTKMSNRSVSPATVPSYGTYGGGYSFTYSYFGETITQVTYNDFQTVTYYYDTLGRTTRAIWTNYNLNGLPVGPAGANFTYYNNDEIKGVSYQNGIIANYTYNKLTQPQTITAKRASTTLLSLIYNYNSTGTVASVTGWSTSTSGTQQTINEQYRYDALRRLVNSALTSGSTTTLLTYSYDNNGNRLSNSINGIATNYNYKTPNDELTSWSNPTAGSSTSYSYDRAGNLLTQTVSTSGGTTHWTYAWDPTGHLTKVSNDAGVQGRYAYDGLGRKIQAIELPPGTIYSPIFYSYHGTETLSEQNEYGSSVNFVYANGLRLARTGMYFPTYYYIADALGSTRLVADANGNLSFSDNYLPFGQDNSSTGSETYRFTGKPYSSATGFYYYYARWYDASVGRFISQDPLAGNPYDIESLNPYLYVQNSPTTSTDPTGMDDCGFSLGGIWGCLVNAGNAITNAWNGLPDWAKVVIIVVAVVALVALTAGVGIIALPEIGVFAGADIAEVTGFGIATGFTAGGLSTISTALGVIAGIGLVATIGAIGYELLAGSDFFGGKGPSPPPPSCIACGTGPTGIGAPKPWPPVPKPKPYTPPPAGGVKYEFGGNKRANKVCGYLAIAAGLGIGIGLIAPDLAKGKADLGRSFTASLAGFATLGAFFFLCAGIAAQF